MSQYVFFTSEAMDSDLQLHIMSESRLLATYGEGRHNASQILMCNSHIHFIGTITPDTQGYLIVLDPDCYGVDRIIPTDTPEDALCRMFIADSQGTRPIGATLDEIADYSKLYTAETHFLGSGDGTRIIDADKPYPKLIGDIGGARFKGIYITKLPMVATGL